MARRRNYSMVEYTMTRFAVERWELFMRVSRHNRQAYRALIYTADPKELVVVSARN